MLFICLYFYFNVYKVIHIDFREFSHRSNHQNRQFGIPC